MFIFNYSIVKLRVALKTSIYYALKVNKFKKLQ